MHSLIFVFFRKISHEQWVDKYGQKYIQKQKSHLQLFMGYNKW